MFLKYKIPELGKSKCVEMAINRNENQHQTLKENHIHMYDHACMTTKCPLYAYRKQ